MKRFSNILLIADESTDYSAALKRAVTLARNNQARLTICAIIDSVPGDMQMAITAVTPAELRDIAVSDKRDWLDGVVKSVPADEAFLESKVLAGKPFIEIIQQVLENDHDLIIKGTGVGCRPHRNGNRRTIWHSRILHGQYRGEHIAPNRLFGVGGQTSGFC